jgi:hypothetical protein
MAHDRLKMHKFALLSLVGDLAGHQARERFPLYAFRRYAMPSAVEEAKERYLRQTG